MNLMNTKENKNEEFPVPVASLLGVQREPKVFRIFLTNVKIWKTEK